MVGLNDFVFFAALFVSLLDGDLLLDLAELGVGDVYFGENTKNKIIKIFFICFKKKY